jgi:acyl-CoA thioesterase-2
VIGQALVAASRTVEDESRVAHSLHGYFLRPGDTTIPILYSVDRIRDGRSFNTRRVVAVQKGQAIFSMSVSFQVMEEGLHHQIDMPAGVKPPEECATEAELRAAYIDKIPEEFKSNFERPRPIEMRFVEPINDFEPEPMSPYQNVWIKAADAMPDDIRLNQCLLAYASDMTLLDTCYRPHGIGWSNDNFQVASLDHAMWFHRPFKTDEWLLYSQDSPYSGGSRGLIASATQEGLIRLHDKTPGL